MVKSPVNSDTLVDLLSWRGQSQPRERLYTFLLDGEADEQHLAYQQLEGRAQAIAATLQAATPPGTRALLLYPPGVEFITALFGCFYANVVAIPAFPPRRNRNMGRLRAISQDSKATVALTTDDVSRRLKNLIIGATDLAMRKYLPPEIMTFSVTPTRFEQMLTFPEGSFLDKDWWNGLMEHRGRSRPQ